MKKLTSFLLITAAVFLAVFLISSIKWTEDIKPVTVVAGELPAVGSYENLKALLAETEKASYGGRGEIMLGRMMMNEAVQASAADGAMKSSAGGGANYSTTNIQVKGVDEADVIKTDGRYIYQINEREVVVAKVYPADEMSVVGRLTFDGDTFAPQELYVDEKYMVVIGSQYFQSGHVPVEKAPRLQIYPSVFMTETVKAIIYDIRDKGNIIWLREVELDGYYVSSRKIGSSLYLVANKYINYYHLMYEESELPAPIYRDSVKETGYQSVSYSDIRYFPHTVEPNYLMIAGINLDRPEKEMEVSTYLGSGQNIYASRENLYVAVTQFDESIEEPSADMRRIPYQRKTGVYKFAMRDGRVTFTGQGEVPGTILNQFSMDEHEGYFRIATTSGDMWRDDEFTSKNNVYILDSSLNTTGSIEDIAPGERIYSVRFMGDRGYMVTFKTVDPLFVIDLENPYAPQVLGYLKIPGYSDYLHPYDENHLIGFGKDAMELQQKTWDGTVRPMAYYLGMKIALFDVSDVSNPIEKYVEFIGDRGTESELLHNHKALLFSPERNLLVFPVTVMEVRGNKIDAYGMPAYGEFVFQGAYIYQLDLSDGFTLREKITHLTEQEIRNSNYYWYNTQVERALYIGDTLYTLSKRMVKANDLASLAEIDSLQLSR